MAPDAFSGITDKQASKLKPSVAQEMTPKQIKQLPVEIIDELPKASFDLIRGDLSDQQLGLVVDTVGSGDGEIIGGPVI